jgi:hypothetical protein
MGQAADQLERYEKFVAKVRAARFYGHYECADYHADLVDKALAELDG